MRKDVPCGRFYRSEVIHSNYSRSATVTHRPRGLAEYGSAVRATDSNARLTAEDRQEAARTDQVLRCSPLFRGRSQSSAPLHPDQKWKSLIYAGLAGTDVSPRCHLRRRRHQLRGLLRGRPPNRVVPAARRRFRNGGGAARDGRLRPARLPARRHAGPALRLPGARPVRTGAGPPLQLGEAAARPVRPCDQRQHRVGRVGLRLPLRQARLAQRPGLRSAHHVLGRGQPVLRLGRRPAAAHRLPPHGDLRGPCEGPDHAAPGRSPRSCAAPTRGSPIRR